MLGRGIPGFGKGSTKARRMRRTLRRCDDATKRRFKKKKLAKAGATVRRRSERRHPGRARAGHMRMGMRVQLQVVWSRPPAAARQASSALVACPRPVRALPSPSPESSGSVSAGSTPKALEPKPRCTRKYCSSVSVVPRHRRRQGSRHAGLDLGKSIPAKRYSFPGASPMVGDTRRPGKLRIWVRSFELHRSVRRPRHN